jgi:hypothetical protein
MKFRFKYLKKFETYQQDKVDEILDKISKSGMQSISKNELDFLDAFGKDDKDKLIHLEYESGLKDFKSNDGYFAFKFSHVDDYGGEKKYYGTITVPDLVCENEKRIDGTIEGYILVLNNDTKVPVFDKNGYDILEFCNGLEYELDNFIDYVIETLEDEKNSR